MEKLITKIKLGQLQDWMDETFNGENDFSEDCSYEILHHKDYGNGEHDIRFSADNVVVRIPELNLSMRNGACEMWDKERDDFFEDWSATFIVTGDGKKLGDDFYYEQDDFVCALNNYAHAYGITYNLDMVCEISLLDFSECENF